MINKTTFHLSIALVLGLSACSKPIETKEELSLLSIEEFSTKACNAFEDLEWEQLEHMLSERELSSFKSEAERSGSTTAFRALLQSKVSCDEITNIETDKRRSRTNYKVYFDNTHFKITHEDNVYSVKDVKLK